VGFSGFENLKLSVLVPLWQEVFMKFNLTVVAPVWFERIIQLPYILYYRLRFGCVVRLIHIENLKFAAVDPADYDQIAKFHWRLCRSTRTCYAFRTVPRGKNQTQNVFWMHRQIANPPDWLLVDHDNHNGLDNRRSNLRLVTHAENQQNCRKTISKTTSRYKGVDFVKATGLWRARIVVNGKRLFLGSFTDEIDAARAYDAAARKYFGEYACLNFKT
jgi:hypothetical protein